MKGIIIDNKINPIELSIIAALINNPYLWFNVSDYLKPEMFVSDLGREIVNYIIGELKNDKVKRINVSEIIAKFDADGRINLAEQIIEAKHYINESIEHSARKIRNSYLLRKIKDLTTNVTFALDEFHKYEDAHRYLINAVKELDEGERAQMKTFNEVGIELIDKIQKSRKLGRSLGIDTGFVTFDNETGGLFDGDLWIISGKPSHGKTIFSQNVLLNISRAGYGCAIISIEMSAIQITHRYISILQKGAINAQKMRRGYNLTDKEVEKIEKTISELDKLPLTILDNEHTIQRILPVLKKEAAFNNTKVFCVDYAQLMTDEDSDTEYKTVTEISKQLKQFAKRENCIVILLSQLSRQGLLRASAQLDQDADIISEIKHEWRDDERQPEHIRDMNTWKARNGNPCKIKIHTQGLLYREYTEMLDIVEGTGRQREDDNPIEIDDTIPF